MEARLDNFLHFPFGFAIDNVRWWSLVIWAVSLGLTIPSQKVDMEDGMDLHGRGKGQAIGHRRQLLIDKERSVSSWS